MPTNLSYPSAAPDQRRLGELRSRWGWFVGLGIALVVLGAVALLDTVMATVAGIWVIATLMLVGGVLQAIHAFGVRTWSSFAWWLLAGLVYIVGGLSALFAPLAASAILTLLIAGFLIAGGVIRIMAGMRAKADRNWGFIVFSGVVALLAGILITVGWPGSSLFVLGTFIAVDFLMQGFAMIAFGMALRR